MRERIAEVDADADGAWSLAEIKAVRPEFDAERFARLDANADGLLQADERQDRHRGRPGGQRRPASP
jgi:hypothetical protein